MEEFASEVLRSSDSLSLLSVPPDIRNWFSSYIYESFPLDTCDFLKDSLAKENECEKDKALVEGLDRENSKETNGKSRCTTEFGLSKDHKHGNGNTYKILDYELSASLPSEPPDVRNWFSSYVYKSPVADTSDGLTESFSSEIVWEKKRGESNNEKREKLKEHRKCNAFPLGIKHEAGSSAEVFDSPNSLSFLSELPDVKNWLSSYAYESPIMDETAELRDSSSQKNEFIIEESDTEEENNTVIIRKTTCRHVVVAADKLNFDCLKENVSGKESCKRKKIQVSPANLHFEQNLEYKVIGQSLNGSTKGEFESLLNQETLLYKAKEESADMDSEPKLEHKLLARTRSSTKEMCVPSLFNEASLTKQKQASQDDISAIASGDKSPKRVNNGNNNKENMPRECSNENGFVTMKNNGYKEAKQQNYVRKLRGGILLQCSRIEGYVKLTGEEANKTVKRRKVFAETTNLQHQSVTEVAGKWVCLRKKKADKGPPLKQLCLDKWVNKV